MTKMQLSKRPKYHVLEVEGYVGEFGQWFIGGDMVEKVQTAEVLNTALTRARQRQSPRRIRVTHMSISPYFAVCMLLDGTLERGHMRRKRYGFTARTGIGGRDKYLRIMGDWPAGQPHVLVCNGRLVL